MHITILGAGGIGGYYGATLARAGHDVQLLARGDHLVVMRAKGLTVRSPEETFTVPMSATDDAAALPDTELVIVAVKSYSLGEVASVATRLADRGAVVLPLLNGVDAAERLAAAGVPREQLLAGLTVVSASKPEPGVIERAAHFRSIAVGELDGSVSDRVERVASAFRDSGSDAQASPNITLDLWKKFNMLCAMAAACGLSRSDVGSVRAAPLGWLLIERAVGEITAVGRACGVPFPEDQEARALRGIASLPGTMKPSFLLDVERGGPNELDVLSGAVARYGRETGVPTPVHDTAAAALVSRQ